jgi:hypothetical protein
VESSPNWLPVRKASMIDISYILHADDGEIRYEEKA